MDIFQFYELSRSRSGTAYFPIFGTTWMRFAISTRSGNIDFNKGDGSAVFAFSTDKYVDYTTTSPTNNLIFTYGSAFTGNFSGLIKKGLKDIYSLNIGVYHQNINGLNSEAKWNITNIETFFAQFTNLYSVYINEYAYQDSARMSVIKGDLAKFPNSVEKVLIDSAEVIGISSGELYLNFSSYTNASQLKSFSFNPINNTLYGLKIIGDLGKLPTTCQKLFIANSRVFAGSAITYTAGKVWASSFDTLYLPIPLKPNENDNLLIDLSNSVTTAIGGKSITLIGGYRTFVSDSAVSGLITKSFAVNCAKLSYTSPPILDLPLQNSFTDVSPSGISMVAGNVNGLPSFVSDGSGGYAVDFGGTKSIKTSVNLPIGTDKVSIEFDIKTTATAAQVVMELSPNFNSNNSFGIFINNDSANKIDIDDHNSGYNVGRSSVNINDGNYHSVKMVIDRSLGTAQNKIYIDGVLSYVQNMSFTADNNGNFGPFTLFIGQRNGSSLGFVGQMKNLKIYNYPIL